MRPRSLLTAIGASALLTFAGASTASAALKVSAKPNKGGSITVGAPTTFKLSGEFPNRTPTGDGNQRLHSMRALLPTNLLFNTIPFKECKMSTFVKTGKCSSSTRLATATVLADGGPDVGKITAKATIYFGTGFSALINVNVDKPAVINEFIVGDLRSSGKQGYGLSMYIPMPWSIHTPLPNLHPTITSINTTIKTPTKRVKIPGQKKRVSLPMAGIGPCTGSRKMNFEFDVQYSNATDTAFQNDLLSGNTRCKR